MIKTCPYGCTSSCKFPHTAFRTACRSQVSCPRLWCGGQSGASRSKSEGLDSCMSDRLPTKGGRILTVVANKRNLQQDVVLELGPSATQVCFSGFLAMLSRGVATHTSERYRERPAAAPTPQKPRMGTHFVAVPGVIPAKLNLAWLNAGA